MTAGGVDIWGVKDEFNFVYVERTGNFDLVSRIESLTAANQYTKAGIMAREDLTPGSRHIYFQVFPDNSPRNKNNGGYEFQYRIVKDSSMKAIYPKSSEGAPEFPVAFPIRGSDCNVSEMSLQATIALMEEPGKYLQLMPLSCHQKSIWDWLLLLIIRTIPHLQSSGI